MPWEQWQRMRDFKKPLNDNKCPMRPLQANSGYCGIVVYTHRAVEAVLQVWSLVSTRLQHSTAEHLITDLSFTCCGVCVCIQCVCACLSVFLHA